MSAIQEINALVKSAQSVTGYVDPAFFKAMHDVGAAYKAKRDAEEYERSVREAEAYKKFVDDNFGGNYELAADASTGLGMVFPEMYLIGGGAAGNAAKSLGAKKAVGTGLAALKSGVGPAWNAVKPAIKAIPGKAKVGWDAIKRWASGDIAGSLVQKATGSNIAGTAAKHLWGKGSVLGSTAAGVANVATKDPAVNHPYLKAAPWAGVVTNPLAIPFYYLGEAGTGYLASNRGWMRFAEKGVENYNHNRKNGTLIDMSPMIGDKKLSLGGSIVDGVGGVVAEEMARRGMDKLRSGGADKIVDGFSDAKDFYDSIPEEEKRRLWEQYGKMRDKSRSMAEKRRADASSPTNSVDNAQSGMDIVMSR